MLLEEHPLDARVRARPAAIGPSVVACLVLAALSLLLPSTPTYDPWAWIIWGREVAHLDLVTTDGPSWKPLPVLFTTVFSTAGDAAPQLWLVIARAGGLLSLVLAFRVARRLGGTVAGVVAVGGLALAPWVVRNSALGNSEGLMAACVLGAVDRHLAGAPRQAFALGLGAALLRPEAWPFLGLYAAWLLWRDRSALAFVAAGLLSLPVLWLGPELWGSGNLNRASERAQNPNANSPAFAAHPVAAVLQDAADMITLPVLAGLLLVALGLVLRRPVAAGGGAAALVLLGMAAAWLGLVAYMTGHGFSGNQRYLVMPVTLVVVVAAVGVGWLAAELRAADPRAAVALGLLGAVAFTAPYWGGTRAMVDGLGYQSRLLTDLEASVAGAGGADRILACGPATTGAFLVPAVAWQLGVHAEDVGLLPRRPGVVFRVSTSPGSHPVPPLATLGPGPVRTLADQGHWRLLEACR